MLVDFEVENFRSYREAKRFSLVASPLVEAFPKNVFATPEPDIKLLKTAAIYGPNGSGKSNLLLGMNLLGDMIRPPTGGRYPDSRLAPFVLESSLAKKPIRFRVRFFVEHMLFEYRIAVTSFAVEEEHLTAYVNGQAQHWFERNGDDLLFPSSKLKGPKSKLKEMTQIWMPFLSLAATFNEQLAMVAHWIINNLGTLSVPASAPALPYSSNNYRSVETTALHHHKDLDFRSWANSFIRHADVGIESIDVELKEKNEISLYFIHSSEDPIKQPVRFGWWAESEGTRELFYLLEPVYEALKQGRVIVLDELNSLHPLMTRELVRLFQDPVTNPKNAQLVFATHDASLLDGRIFRRDQVWFTEKDRSGATDLYSLLDFKPKERDGEEAVTEAGYLRGRYGAIPFFTPYNVPAVPNGTTHGGQSAERTPKGSEPSRTRKRGKKVHPDRDGG
jgi:AAA15 family ATPase/GTPase